jgi:hypothetical protein
MMVARLVIQVIMIAQSAVIIMIAQASVVTHVMTHATFAPVAVLREGWCAVEGQGQRKR